MAKTKPKQKYFCYLLRCKDGSLYSGITNDLAKRELAHNSGRGSKFVLSRGGGRIVYSEILRNKSVALKREAAIKKMARSGKLLLIRGAKKRAGKNS